MVELQTLFNNAVDNWQTSVEEKEPWLSLGLTFEEFKMIVENPTNIFYTFYHNEQFQNVIINMIAQQKEMKC